MNRIHFGPLDLYGCSDAVARLEPFLDGELPLAQRRKVAFHLRICRECAPLFRFEAGLNSRIEETLSSAPLQNETRALVERALSEARGSDGDLPSPK